MRATIALAIWLSYLGVCFAREVPLRYASPDSALVVRVIPVGRESGATKIVDPEGDVLEYECRIEIRTRKGAKRLSQDFGSADADHGRGLAFGSWTPDSQFFVFSTVNSGGHHPWQFYTYAYSRAKNRFYILDPLVGEVTEKQFTVAPPDTVTLKVLDRDAMARDDSLEFPARKVAICLSKLLSGNRPPPEKVIVHPPMRGYFQ